MDKSILKSSIYEYYRKINSGEIKVGKWIHKIYDILIDGLEQGKWFYDEKKQINA